MPSHQSPPASAACVSGYEDQGRRLGKHWSVISPTQTPWIPAFAGKTGWLHSVCRPRGRGWGQTPTPYYSHPHPTFGPFVEQSQHRNDGNCGLDGFVCT